MLSKRVYTLYIPFLGFMDATKLSQPPSGFRESLALYSALETK
jgi:hypothetical protein